MNRDFYGFTFGLYHSSDFNLYAVSSSNRYEKNLLPAPIDTTSDISGSNGQYYFGSIFKNREFKISVAFDSITEPMWRKMAQVFATDKPQDFIFDENPYKVYKAKLKAKPDFKFVCFKDAQTGERIYKGEGTLTFICYHPLAYCFNKYVVRAADFYKCTQPQNIINGNSIEINPYRKDPKPKMLSGLIKDHYNVKPNMSTPWKGGYPSIEQVQWGELYFNESHENGYKVNCEDETTKEKGLIVDVRHYWDNIPKWQETAKLLVSPTLDYNRNLIYMPQYSQTNYYNMDTGLNRQNGLIGSRILVYNPGDVPVSFELRLGNLVEKFRNNPNPTKFRVSRYNVQRLTIEQAVDWTKLKTYDPDDNDSFKYGTRYVGIAEKPLAASSDEPDFLKFRHLDNSHPEVLYYVEPIPKQKLGDFIRLFYWQTHTVLANTVNLGSTINSRVQVYIEKNILNIEDGKEFANRYEEMLSLCMTEDEENELYWDTLYHLFNKYKEVNDYLSENTSFTPFFSENYTFDDFYYDFIQNPPEYIRDDDLEYGQYNFNIGSYPQYITDDYLEISNKDFEKINVNGACTLFLDFERHLLYNINESEDFYDFKPTKSSWNDNIIKGKWFMLPPGWSLIDISPVSDENVWGGKRWLDARPFDWGTTDESKREEFNKYERLAIIDYVSKASPISNLHRDLTVATTNPLTSAGVHPINETDSNAERRAALVAANLDLDDLEDLIQFRRWFDEDSSYNYYYNNIGANASTYRNTLLGLGFEIWKNKVEQVEYKYLKLLAEYWRAYHLDANGLPDPNHDIDEFWWYASNYLIINFPPLYWGYIDLLNKLEIKYVPQFY